VTTPLWEAFSPLIREEDDGIFENLSSFKLARDEYNLNKVDRSIDEGTEIEHPAIAKRLKILRDISRLKPRDANLLAQCKVEFLHRTVLDFLNRPEIWEQFLAATNNSFKPYAAVAQSWLLQLKWVYSNTSLVHAMPL
jgi:hypothetical protein